jgi:acyl carrier protein
MFETIEFLRQMEEVLEMDENTLIMDTILDESTGWDSLSMLAFIAMIDDSYETTLEVEDLKSCETVGDLANLVEENVK